MNDEIKVNSENTPRKNLATLGQVKDALDKRDEKIDSLNGDLVNESQYRESLAKSVGSKLKHGVNLFDSTDLEGKKFSDIAVDDPSGSYNWIYNCEGLIAEDIPSGSYVLLMAFDNSGSLIPMANNFDFLIFDANGEYIGVLYSSNREQIQYDIPKGSKIKIQLSKNLTQYKDTIFSGITFLKQTFDGTNQIFKPTISEYVPYEENYINNNGVVYIGNGTNFNIKNGLAYAVENNLTAIINKGVYDLVSEGISGDGNKLPKHLIGYGVTLKADLPTENWDWSPLNVDMNRDETIVEGLTIEVSNCRYCIHDEMYNRTEPYHNVFKNLRLVHKTGATSTLIAPHCIGGGFGNGGIIEIENVIVSANLYKDISYHACAGTPRIVNRVYVKDSIVKHCVEVSNATPTNPYVEQFVNKVYVSNCILGRQPITDVDGHIQIVAWNNTINTNADID